MNREFWMKTDERIKAEYFSSTSTTDDKTTNTFFGIRDKDGQEENIKGQYLPVDLGEDIDADLKKKYFKTLAESFEKDTHLKTQKRSFRRTWFQSEAYKDNDFPVLFFPGKTTKTWAERWKQAFTWNAQCEKQLEKLNEERIAML